jgi:hypothetical protein
LSVEEAEVVEAEPQEERPVDTHAEREAADALRVVADGAEHVRVHHPAAEDLEPAGALADTAAGSTPPARSRAAHAADVHLGDGSVNGKKLGRKRTGVVAPKRRCRNWDEDALQVGEGDTLVHPETFHLLEHR